jgi:uncharacterized protein (TIRG00374 family)
VLGLVASALLIWWTLHDVRFVEVWDQVRGVRWVPFLVAIVMATFTFPLRTIRWQYLLRIEGEPLPFVPLWHATAIGFMSTNLLPARAGEFARAYAARRLTGTRFTAAFGSIAVERVFDGITLVAFLATAMWFGGFGGDTTIGTITLGTLSKLAAAGFSLALLVSAGFVRWPQPALRATRSLTGRVLPDRWSRFLVEAGEGLISGLDSLRSPKRFFAVSVWSVAVWVSGAASFLVGFHAFGIEVPWTAGLMLQSLLAFGVAVQFSPGFFGQFEAVCRLTLALYAVGVGPAVSFAFGFHLGGFIPITVLGLWSLSRAHLHLADLKATNSEPYE